MNVNSHAVTTDEGEVGSLRKYPLSPRWQNVQELARHCCGQACCQHSGHMCKVPEAGGRLTCSPMGIHGAGAWVAGSWQAAAWRRWWDGSGREASREEAAAEVPVRGGDGNERGFEEMGTRVDRTCRWPGWEVVRGTSQVCYPDYSLCRWVGATICRDGDDMEEQVGVEAPVSGSVGCART